MRIAIIGPQNTGKSTLLQDILVSFPRYATTKLTYRDIVKQNNLEINRETTEESQRAIRDFLNKQISGNKKGNIIFDRCVVDNFIYSKAMDETSDNFLTETENIMYASLDFLDALLFIPTTISIPLEADGIRDTNTSYVDKINSLFIETLFEIIKKRKIPIHVISGTRKERINQVKKILNTEKP